jgi:hypothetical protein
MSILDLFGRKVTSDEPVGIVDMTGRKVTLGPKGQEIGSLEGSRPSQAGSLTSEKKARHLAVTGFRLIALCSDRHMRDMGITPELAIDLMAVVKKHRPKLAPEPLMVIQAVKKRRTPNAERPTPNFSAGEPE